LDSAQAAAATLVAVQFDGPVAARPADAARFVLDDSLRPVRLESLGANRLLLVFQQPMLPGWHSLAIQPGLLDAHLRPVGLPLADQFLYNPVQPAPLFLANWFAPNDYTAVLQFNTDLLPGSLPDARFELLPHGSVAQVQQTAANTLELQVTNARLAATGVPISIRVSGLVGTGGEAILRNQGDVATFAPAAADDLSGVYVFPNPARTAELDGTVRFGGLPRGCAVTVTTEAGVPLASFRETGTDGGEPYNLRDYSGRRLSPGVYVYIVTGAEGQRRVGKFAVLD
jgi:hypothetical protein